MEKLSSILLMILFIAGYSDLHGQGVRGRVIDQNGTPLSFTTIFIEESGSGSVTNVNGTYEIKLQPGTFTLNFQHLGYAGTRKKVVIADGWTTLDVVLQEQAYLLQAAEIEGGKEDPAYKIMRKAIAKSAFHREQVDRYTCMVYLKGGGRLVDYPWFMKKVIEDEGIDTAAAFIEESITEITYERPGKYTEHVVSIRSSGDDQDTNPMNYINGSFYEENVAGIVSPLSKKAFAYYRFRYVNTFDDRGYNINKIEVIPRVRDEEFVSGYLYIVEDLWSINSVDFVIVPQGITINIEQNFAPIKPDVWMPISHKYEGEGKLFGFEFTFQYLATVSDYEVTINPDLDYNFEVLDVKTEKEEIEQAKASAKKASETEEKLLSGEEVSTKELRKLMRAYEKEERKKREEPTVVSERKVVIDSMAYKKDSLYWAQIRPVPLTAREVKGYALQDSLAEASAKEAEGDTLRGKKGFRFIDPILGATYDLENDQILRIHNPLASIRYNTVDGWNGEYKLSYFKRFENKARLEVSPLFRYAHSRDRGFGKVDFGYDYGQGIRKGKFSLEGGSYYAQINRDQPITPFTNTISSLFAQNNFMKIYDRQFVELNWRQNLSTKWTGSLGIEYSRRKETFNTTNQTWINVDDKDYRPNAPLNVELPNTSFGESTAFKVRMSATWMPFAYAYKREEQYYRVRNNPVLTLRYEGALPGIGEATINYDLLALEVKHSLEVGVLGTLNLRTEGGKFLSSARMDFPDFAHFMGNGTIFTRFEQMTSYSIMPYYPYSTKDEYLSTYINFEWRQLLLSQFTLLRLAGLTEHFNVNHLITPSVNNYTEIGYSVTNIFRLFRIDVTGAFLDGKYEDFRVQIGITSNLFQFD